MITLPEGWASCKIIDLSERIFDGPFGSNLATSDYTDSGVLVARLENVSWLKFNRDKETFISDEKFYKLAHHELQAGDILVGSFVDNRVRVCLVPDNLRHRIINKADVFCVRSNRDQVDAKYVLYKLASPAIYRQLSETAVHGATRPRIKLSDLKQLSIGVPPLPEQRRIIAKIDHLMGRSKRVRDDLNLMRVLVDRYRGALLSKAFDGCLLNSNRKGQPRVSVSAYLAEKIRNGLSIAGSDLPPGIPALRLSAIRSDIVDMADVRYLAIDLDRASKYFLEPGDILVSRGNGALRLVGKAAVVPTNCENVIYPDTAFRLRPDPSVVDARWLLWMWNAPQMRSQIEATARTTAGIWKISQADITSFELPDVPISEQREIVRNIERAFAAIDRLAAEAHSARDALDKLDQAILAKAFRGELVPQDPNDEPASVLLERIRAERAAAGPAPKRGRRPRGAVA